MIRQVEKFGFAGFDDHDHLTRTRLERTHLAPASSSFVKRESHASIENRHTKEHSSMIEDLYDVSLLSSHWGKFVRSRPPQLLHGLRIVCKFALQFSLSLLAFLP